MGVLEFFAQETSTAEQLANEILAAASCDPETMKSKEAVRRQIANRVRHDFAQGTVVSVDGWLLSLTEACVLAALSLVRKVQSDT
jgi:hypothetical protein